MALTEVNSTSIKDGTIVNADVNASAAIAGTKIAPDFGSQDVDTTGNILLDSDTNKLKIGDGEDLEIYHNATNSFVETSTGNLYLKSTADDVVVTAADDFIVLLENNESGIRSKSGGATELYYDGVKKFETTSSGVTVTGDLTFADSAAHDIILQGGKIYGETAAAGALTIQSTNGNSNHAAIIVGENYGSDNGGITFYGAGSSSADVKMRIRGNTDNIEIPDDHKLTFGDGSDLQIYHDGDDNWIKATNGHIKIEAPASKSAYILVNETEYAAKFNENGKVEIYYDGTKRLETDSQSINILGDEGESCHVYIYADEGDDNADCWRLKADHTASSFYLQNYAGGNWNHTNIKANGGGSVELYYNNVKKFETTDQGVKGAGRQQIEKAGSGGGAVPTSLTRENTYLHLGGNEWGTSNNGFFGIGFGYTANTLTNCRAYVAFRETSHTGYTEGDLVFEIVDGTSDSASTEHFRIAHDGTLTGTDTSIGSNSDQRLKTNIADFTYDLAKFKQFKPKTFDWKNPGEHGNKTGQRGFLAQDIEPIDNYLVGECLIDDDDPDRSLVDSDGKSKTSRLGKNDAMYISVIQQLVTKIETLETKVAALEG